MSAPPRRLRRLALALLLPAWLATCATKGTRAEPAPAPATPFQFGLVADIQYADKDTAGSRHYRASLASLRICTDSWRALPLAFAIQLGDVVDGRGTVDASREDLETVLGVLGELPFPVRHVLGNHCFSVPRDELLPRLGLPSAWYSFERAGWRFVVLDSLDESVCAWPQGSEHWTRARAWLDAHPRPETPCAYDWNGGVGAEQLAWLREELADAEREGDAVVVLSHLPVLADASTPHHILWNHAEVLAVLEASPAVVAYFAGHDHAGGYALHAGIHFVTLEGMVESPAGEGAYAVVTAYEDRLEIEGFGGATSRSLPIARR